MHYVFQSEERCIITGNPRLMAGVVCESAYTLRMMNTIFTLENPEMEGLRAVHELILGGE
jgi:hypothetical protein